MDFFLRLKIPLRYLGSGILQSILPVFLNSALVFIVLPL